MATRIQLRRDTAVNWASTNPVLSLGEPGVEIDTHNMKVGDGGTAWNDLAYTAKDAGLESVFVSMDYDYSQRPRISRDGVNWTAETNTGSSGTRNSSEFNSYGIAIGNGIIAYRGYNDLSNKEEIRYSEGPYQAAIQPVSDITRVGPNGEELNWNTLTFGGGYFVAGGWYYDDDRNDFNYPIAAYSADGATWTKINIDLDFVKTKVDAQRTAHGNNTTNGMRISSVTHGVNGWLFTLDYESNGTNWENNSNRLNPGAFYITNITTALNISSYFASMPAVNWSAWFDGHGWFAFYSNKIIYKNTSSDPSQGTWTDIDWENITDNINFASGGDYYGVEEIAAGELDDVNYMVIGDYYGVIYYTSNQGTTWDYVTPGPAYAGITGLAREVNGGIFLGSTNSVAWGQSPEYDWNGEKITISGSYVVELNGTWWIDQYDNTYDNWPLYSDRAKQNRVDASGFAAYDIVTKYVAYGKKGDNSIILPDTTNIVVGQRVYGIDAVRTKEDIDGDWAEPNLVTSVNTDTNRITLKYPLYLDFTNSNISFQAVVKYTHGEDIRDIVYGDGKFVVTGNDSDRVYSTTNMTDWHFTVNAGNQGGFDSLAYGQLDIKKNALRNDSATITGITNSLTLGDTFNVNVVGMTDRQAGQYAYFGATDFNEGSLSIDPSNGSWYLGTYDNDRGREVAIYTYTGQQQPLGPNPNNTGFDYNDHATGVGIETENSNFYFEDYYGKFVAENIAIGFTNDTYNEHYDYNHIDNIFIDGNDIYTPAGRELTIYNEYDLILGNGGIHIHWDNTAHVRVNNYGVKISDHTHDWEFTDDLDGVLYAPSSSDIDIGGYWTIGRGNSSAGWPYIGAVNNLNTPQTDPYDFVIQAGQSYDGPTVNNYWYFNRNGTLQLPPSGDISVSGYWLIGNDTAKIYANDIVTNGEVKDIVVKAGAKEWQFLQDGKFKLPAAGDIVNSDGDSVLNQDIPQNAVSADGDYTLVIGDRGKHIYKTGTGDVLIPTNADVAFGIGTCITLVTGSTNSTQIAPVTSGTTTVILSKFGANANINVPADTYVTVLKIDTDKWIVQT